MPPRTTQKSCRPRVSDRIIVGTLANASACEASGPEGVEPSRHETLEWKPSTGLVSLEYLAISRQPRQKILRDRDGAGCKGQHLCPLGGDREHFFLDIPSYRITYETVDNVATLQTNDAQKAKIRRNCCGHAVPPHVNCPVMSEHRQNRK